MARLRPNLHTTVSRCVCIQGILKVKVKGRDTGTFVLDLKSHFLAGKWLDCDQTCTRWSAGEPASRVCSRSRSRSKVTWYGHFCPRPKITFSRRQTARLRPNLHTMVYMVSLHPGCAQGQGQRLRDTVGANCVQCCTDPLVIYDHWTRLYSLECSSHRKLTASDG